MDARAKQPLRGWRRLPQRDEVHLPHQPVVAFRGLQLDRAVGGLVLEGAVGQVPAQGASPITQVTVARGPSAFPRWSATARQSGRCRSGSVLAQMQKPRE